MRALLPQPKEPVEGGDDSRPAACPEAEPPNAPAPAPSFLEANFGKGKSAGDGELWKRGPA